MAERLVGAGGGLLERGAGLGGADIDGLHGVGDGLRGVLPSRDGGSEVRAGQQVHERFQAGVVGEGRVLGDGRGGGKEALGLVELHARLLPKAATSIKLQQHISLI